MAMGVFSSVEDLEQAVIQAINYTRPYVNEVTLPIALNLAEEIILDQLKQYDSILDIPGIYTLLFEVASWRINILGIEGVSSETYNGQTQTLIKDIPANIRRMLNSKKKVGTI